MPGGSLPCKTLRTLTYTILNQLHIINLFGCVFSSTRCYSKKIPISNLPLFFSIYRLLRSAAHKHSETAVRALRRQRDSVERQTWNIKARAHVSRHRAPGIPGTQLPISACMGLREPTAAAGYIRQEQDSLCKGLL